MKPSGFGVFFMGRYLIKKIFFKKSYYIALNVRASLKVIFSVGPGVVMAALKIPF